MLKRLFAFALLLMLLLSACGGDEESDVDATVQAAVDATQAAAPTETAVPPTDTPVPPTDTPEPEPSPTAETQVLDLDEASVSFSPQEANFATDMTFRVEVEGNVASELLIDGVTNANGNSSITYDFSNADIAAAETTVTIIELDDTTYFSMPDGTCVSSAMGDLPMQDMVRNTGNIVLDAEDMVTDQLQWNGTAEVNGITTDEYLIDADNIVDATGITNMTDGVLNVAKDGNYVVRLILEGRGSSEVLAPGVSGELFYELNFTPSETPFEIEVPANCTSLGVTDTGDGDTDGDTGDGDGGDAAEIVISQMSTSVSHQCQGGNVVVEGASNSITLTGTCNEVVVNSAGNSIDIEAASAIIVNGGGNNITYGGSPTITDNGLGNVITQR